MRPGWKAFRWTTSGYDRRMQEPSEWLSEYQSEADAAPQLTASEEAALLAAFSAGDRSASQALLVAHKRLVLAVARKYIRTGPPALETLVRAGDAALHTALDKFDPSKGSRFSTYVTWWIRQAINRSGGGAGRGTPDAPNWN